MEEFVDEIMDIIERKLDDRGISPTAQELDEIRFSLDDMLKDYEE